MWTNAFSQVRPCTPGRVKAVAGSICCIRCCSSCCSQPCCNVSSSLGSCVAVRNVVTQTPPAEHAVWALIGILGREGEQRRAVGGGDQELDGEGGGKPEERGGLAEVMHS